MIDAHNHLQDPRFDRRRTKVIEVMRNAGITGCVVNGTCEKDWPNVASLAEDYPRFVIPSFGLHPWQVGSRSKDWLSKLHALLDKYPEAAIGECGLDRWMTNPDLPSQHQVFRAQLALALEKQRPVTIHCLKAWGPLLEDLKSCPKLPPILLHSFGGSLEVANQLVKLGAFFSFSGYFLHPRKAKVRQVFSQLPTDRILVETDAPDMAMPDPAYHLEELNHPANLGSISRRLAELCQIPEEVFSRNARRFFGLS